MQSCSFLMVRENDGGSDNPVELAAHDTCPRDAPLDRTTHALVLQIASTMIRCRVWLCGRAPMIAWFTFKLSICRLCGSTDALPLVVASCYCYHQKEASQRLQIPTLLPIVVASFPDDKLGAPSRSFRAALTFQREQRRGACASSVLKPLQSLDKQVWSVLCSIA